ncbi:MAG: single-stranded DNA-binding protein [Actinomycetota bacterium]|nr:single-stranded DNA-binding protein [Actinomycetota bacterium]
MFETPITVVGNIVNNPYRQRVGDQEVVRFRVASNSRRRTADGSWEQGNSLFVSVSCWGKLVTGVGASLGKGDAVIVVGHVHTSEYDDREGVRRSSVEVRATAVGPDLSRCVARIETLRQSGAPAPEAAETGGEVAEGADAEADHTGPGHHDAAEALPLTA